MNGRKQACQARGLCGFFWQITNFHVATAILYRLKQKALSVFTCIVIGVASLSAQPESLPPSPSAKAKAACLINFAKYIEWPAGAVLEATNPVTIGVLGNSPVADVLEQAVAAQSFGKREIRIRRTSQVRELRGCQIVYISGVAAEHVPDLLAELRDCPTLTVGELPQFLEKGMIIFVSEHGSVRFDVNLANVEPVGLKISARMLATARKVYPAAGTAKP